MRTEWQIYLRESKGKIKTVFWSLGLSLLFFALEIPKTPKEQLFTNLQVKISFGLMIFLCYYVAYAALWAYLVREKIRKNAPVVRTPSTLVHFAVCMPALTAGTLLGRIAEGYITGQPTETSDFLYSLTIGTFITAVFIFYYSFKYSNEENLKLKAANSEAKYQVLENQMKPHFLFNSLNSLSELIEENPQRASEMAQKLSNLYRQILQNSKLRTASLESELFIVNEYLELERIRYGERLQIRVAAPAGAENIFVPSLILQTLVENSIKHGISKSIEGGLVAVDVRAHEKGYQLSVTNTAGDFPQAGNSHGTGLENTRTRLNLLYGDAHGFQLDFLEGNTRATFTVTGAQL